MKYLRSRVGAIGAGLYLLAFAGASIYPLFDRRTFSGLLAVLLSRPWIDSELALRHRISRGLERRHNLCRLGTRDRVVSQCARSPSQNGPTSKIETGKDNHIANMESDRAAEGLGAD
jgi:hypothetical protein